MMLAWFSPDGPLDRHEPAVARRGRARRTRRAGTGRRRASRAGGEHPHELVGVDEAALGEPQRPSARTPRAARSARPPAPRGAPRSGGPGASRGTPRSPAARRPATGTRPWIVTPSRPEPLGRGRVAARRRRGGRSSETSRTGQTWRITRLPWRRWPGGRRAWTRADRAERLEQHPLELGQLHDAPGGVAHRRQVAHLGDHEEPLVPRVALRDRPEEVDVLDRRQPLEVEVLQPVQLQALGHHRVGVAEEGLLRVARRPAAGRKVKCCMPPGPADRDARSGGRDAAGRRPARTARISRGVGVGVARALRPPEEDVAHELPPGRGGGGEAAHAARAPRRGPRRRRA